MVKLPKWMWRSVISYYRIRRGGRCIEVGEMTRPRQKLHRRMSADPTGKTSRVRRRQDFVIAAPEDERGAFDPMQAPFEPRVGERPQQPGGGFARAGHDDLPFGGLHAVGGCGKSLVSGGVIHKERRYRAGFLSPELARWCRFI